METPLPTVPAGPPSPPPSGGSSLPPAPGRAAGSASVTVGQLFGRTLRTWARNALFLSLLGALGGLPMAVASYRMYSEVGLFPDPVAAGQDPFAANPLFTHWRTYLAGMLVTMLVWSVANAAAVHLAAQELRGEKVRRGAAMAAAFHRGPYVVALVALVSLATIATSCTLVVPFVLMTGWCASVPATVLEGLGPVRALARSWSLTRGHRWTLFLGFLLVTLPVAFVALALQSIGMAIVFAAGGRDALGPGRALAAAMFAYQVIASMLGIMTMVVCAVAHHRLHVVKEGGDPAALGRIFE